MAEETNSPESEKVACEICLKEVPKSESKNAEVQDYVFHFCGIECFDKWKHQSDNKEE